MVHVGMKLYAMRLPIVVSGVVDQTEAAHYWLQQDRFRTTLEFDVAAAATTAHL